VIVLGTIVVLEWMRLAPEPKVLAWAHGLDPGAVAITAMNEAESRTAWPGSQLASVSSSSSRAGMPWQPSYSLAKSGPSPVKRPTGTPNC